MKKEYAAYQIEIKRGDKLYPYFLEICQNAKNLYNTTNSIFAKCIQLLNNKKFSTHYKYILKS